jgi:hypothetical protein
MTEGRPGSAGASRSRRETDWGAIRGPPILDPEIDALGTVELIEGSLTVLVRYQQANVQAVPDDRRAREDE